MTNIHETLDLKKMKSLLSYCYTCNACDMVCPLNLIKKFSPRFYLTQLKKNGLRDIDSFLAENDELFKCLTCQMCMKECPMSTQEEGMNFIEIIRILREYAFQKKLEGKLLQQSCTHGSKMPIHSILQSQSEVANNSIEYIKSDSSLKIADTGEIGFFIGCFQFMENLFDIKNHDFTDIARGAIKILNLNNVTPVVLETKCCGHDLYWMGDKENAKRLAENNVQKYKKAGVKTILAECAEGYYMWKHVYPQLVPECDFKVLHFSEYLVQSDLLSRIIMHPLKMTVTYHDPCRLGRLSKIYDAPRQILSKLEGIDYVEMKHNRSSSYCCGVPLFLDCNAEKKVLRELRIQEAMDIEVDYIITTCPKCIVHYNCYLNELSTNLHVDQNKDKLPKLIDLSTFLARYMMLI